ncbi:DNA primase [Helicobacter pylori]|uniref:DNA primase n=1 Tax=Helicobacter pylori TaxID=210 RepID=UPI001933644A|nr:DNA primase [Helicobacter pylori]MBS3012800.1 DNA primase [Helicobacter pylori]MBS3014275.1 DNA primase [Helicobacter pylori]QQO40003.1 DNA primase [Helicobacter phage COL 2-PUJ]QQO40024.1 DNA primase [Helicobacter phage COL 16-PUJ]
MKITNLEPLKERILIMEVLECYLDLYKAGANFKASCPFHDERSASFMVSPEKNIYHCFGCGVSGDALKFLQEYKKLSFVEAVEEVAKIYNYPLEYETNAKTEKNNHLKEILAYANKLFKERLKNEPKVLNYLTQNRAISLEMIEAYDLGYCLHGDLEVLKERFTDDDLIACGLFSNKNEDKELRSFCNYRITIPLKDSKGYIRSFSARLCIPRLLKANNAPKYLNGRETSLYNKSFFLYNYHRALESIKEKKQVIICEGFFDVLACEHFNYLNAICTSGTAFTKEHLVFLNKLNVELCFSFDNDNAGIEATIRALDLCLKNHITNASVIKIKDPSIKDLSDYQKLNKLPNLTKINGFKFYCAYLLREGLPTPQKDFNYKSILKTLEVFEPFMQADLIKILNSFLKQKSVKTLKEKTTGKLDLLEARVYATMLESEEFRYIARRYLTPSDVQYPTFFKRIVCSDFRGLDFLKKFKSIPESYQKSSLVELKTKGLKNSLAYALERKDYALVEAINAKIKEIQKA